MPIGRFRCGFLVSSAAVEIVEADVGEENDRGALMDAVKPFGANGRSWQG